MHLLSALNPELIIKTAGTIGVIAIIFIETGLLVGFFLPGDSLLFTAGFFASQGYASFAWLLIGCFLAATIGDTVGYFFGKKAGPAIFTKEDSWVFNKKHIERAQKFYETYGKKTIVLARFVPVVRTFAPVLAGVGGMDYPTFITYNLFGGLGWTWLMLWLGFILGSIIPDPDRYILPIVIIIIFVSFIPPIREYLKARRATI